MNATDKTMTSVAERMVSPCERQSVAISASGCEIAGELVIPAGARGLVISMMNFGRTADEAGSERLAQHFENYGLATLWFRAPGAASTDSLAGSCDFELLMRTRQLLQVTHWAKRDLRTRQLGMGYLGAGINAAAALVAAAQLGYAIQAVVAYDSLPDAAGNALAQVTAPTLLIVKEGDETSLRCNRLACGHLVCRREMMVVPQSEHGCTRSETLERVATLATNWFLDQLEPIRRL